MVTFCLQTFAESFIDVCALPESSRSRCDPGAGPAESGTAPAPGQHVALVQSADREQR